MPFPTDVASRWTETIRDVVEMAEGHRVKMAVLRQVSPNEVFETSPNGQTIAQTIFISPAPFLAL